MTRVAFVGCGFVADMYLQTLRLHPGLELAGVFDRDPERLLRFGGHYGVFRYERLEQLTEDSAVDIVVNLTDPGSHFEVSKACLEAGKHVYSEKPLALDLGRARVLVEIAEARGLQLSCAPCSLLSESAQTVWKALREKRVGAVRVAYAEMDDGLLHRMNYRDWVSESGTSWPYKNEMETGCTLEHAGYQVSWLAAFFGPARSIVAFASEQIPQKGTDVPLEVRAPDFSVACIRFSSGVVARLTCSIIAPRDHSLRIIGDDGVLSVPDTWRSRSPVYLQRWVRIRRRTFLSPWKRRYPLVGRENRRLRRRGAPQGDFARGIAELARAIAEGRPPHLSSRFCLHVNEVVLAIQSGSDRGGTYEVSSSFDPIEPMPWAAS